jgi:ribosomal protein S14
MANGSITAFLGRVQKTDGCWIWTGALNDSGYGVLKWLGRENVRAHRVSYEIHVGPIPEGSIVRHDCDNPPCVRPDHLRPGTDADNMADKVARGRAVGNGLYGDRHPQSKLNDDAVREIRRAMKDGVKAAVLSKIYGVTRYAIRQAACGATWSHVD